MAGKTLALINFRERGKYPVPVCGGCIKKYHREAAANWSEMGAMSLCEDIFMSARHFKKVSVALYVIWFREE